MPNLFAVRQNHDLKRKMSAMRRPGFVPGTGVEGWLGIRAWAMGAAGVLLLIAGCQELPQNAMEIPGSSPETPESAVAASNSNSNSNSEAMWPAMKLNEDLYKTITPSNNRDWRPEQVKLTTAEFHGNQVTLRNIRNCRWHSEEDVTVAYYEKTLDLDKLQTVDFIVVPFNDMPSIGHTMVSFGFDGEDYVAVSVEIRKEQGEQYSPVNGFFRQYELIYVVADERDVIEKRVNCDLSDVYLYRSTATPKQAVALFKDFMQRVNKLSREPEFYDTLTNNCTTNLRNHINNLKPNEIPYDFRVLLPGHSDQLAYDLGLIERYGSYEETRERARVNYQACLYRDAPDFSRQIRR
jgi:hypothetical protein